NGIIIGQFSFDNNSNGYKIFSGSTYSKDNLFGYFYINKTALNNSLSNTGILFSQSFNSGKVFKNIILKDLNINSLNNSSIFEINLNTFKIFKDDFVGNKNNIIIPKDYYINFNLYF
ncbi:MAG: hypothetical protein PHE25_04205, partial [Candidatus Gracilibacteria bacterium]|nr:hypothetical protein [Candidatus Gracilibacteria bacterium]